MTESETEHWIDLGATLVTAQREGGDKAVDEVLAGWGIGLTESGRASLYVKLFEMRQGGLVARINRLRTELAEAEAELAELEADAGATAS